MKQSKPPQQFVVCVAQGDYPVSLAPWKIYRRVPDADAAAHGQVRIIDETGEDYLFPTSCFKPVALSRELGRLFPRSTPNRRTKSRSDRHSA